MNSMFNRQGQLNAYDRTDALNQLIKYASVLSNNVPANAAPAGESFSTDQREAMLKKALMTQEGKVALGQAMANPIRRALD